MSRLEVGSLDEVKVTEDGQVTLRGRLTDGQKFFVSLPLENILIAFPKVFSPELVKAAREIQRLREQVRRAVETNDPSEEAKEE